MLVCEALSAKNPFDEGRVLEGRVLEGRVLEGRVLESRVLESRVLDKSLHAHDLCFVCRQS